MVAQTRKSEFFRGARDSLPLIIGAVPFGIIFGTLSGSAGLSVAGTLECPSSFLPARPIHRHGTGGGRNGLAHDCIDHLRGQFPPPFIYGHTAAPLKKLPQRWQALLAFGLTDETFAVAVEGGGSLTIRPTSTGTSWDP